MDKQTARRDREKISVVVVDDHPLFLAGLQQLFIKQPDFKLVGVAESAIQLESVLAQTVPAVILMDIEMPERDGISATAFVRKHAPRTKVVILTGYANPDHIFRVLSAGAVGYLLKNTRPEVIVDTLRRVATGERFRNPELAGTCLHKLQHDQGVEDGRRLVHTLTPREEEVLRLVATGAKNREISQRLVISELTVKMHLVSIFDKLQVHNRTKAAILAVKAGLSPHEA